MNHSRLYTGIVYVCSTLAGGCVVLFYAVILGGVGVAAYATGWDGIPAAFGLYWNPEAGAFGLLPMIAGSIMLAGLSTMLAIPLCLGVVAFLWGTPPSPARETLRFLLRFMVGIPTIVYAFCAFVLLTPLLRQAMAGTGLGLFTAALVLALLVIPAMAAALDTALQHQLGDTAGLPMAAAALGLSRQQTFWLIALPSQKHWLGTGVLLAFGRALGDTMIPLLLAGNAPLFPDNIFAGVRTLATHISLLTATEITPQVELALYLSALLLLVTSAGISVCTALVRKRGV